MEGSRSTLVPGERPRLAVWDPDNLWSLLEGQFLQRLPLTVELPEDLQRIGLSAADRAHAAPRVFLDIVDGRTGFYNDADAGRLGTSDADSATLSATTAYMRHLQTHASPKQTSWGYRHSPAATWYKAPYVTLYLLKCSDVDTYKLKAKPALLAFLNRIAPTDASDNAPRTLTHAGAHKVMVVQVFVDRAKGHRWV